MNDIFKVRYYGENEIEIDDLTNALLGVNELLKKSQFIDKKNKLKVTTFREGSWEIVFSVVQQGLALAGSTITILDFIEKMKTLYVFLDGKLANNIKPLEDGKISIEKNNQPTINISDNATVGSINMVVHQHIYEAYEKKGVREAFQQIAKPAYNRENEFFISTSDEEQKVYFDKDDVSAIVKSTLDEREVIDITHEIRQFHVITFSVDIKHDFIMRKTNSKDTLRYSLEDYDFLEKIKRREQGFVDGDIMVARIRIETKITNNKRISNNRIIEEVIDYIPAVNSLF